MAEKRMLSKKVLDTDAFLDMPLSAQALYFHLVINADDEGFVGNPKRIRDYIGADESDLDLLIEKKFVLMLKSSVAVAMLDRIIQNLYEDKVCGNLTEERFKKLSQTYEQEQAELTEKIDALRADIAAVKKDEEDISRFMRLVKKYTELTEMTPEVVRTFIDKILIHKRQSDKQRSQEVEIIYNCVGGIPEIES